MPKPYALLRAGFPYLKTVGVKGVIDDPLDIAFGGEGRVYVLGSAPIRITNIDHEDLGTIGERSYNPDYGSNGDAISVSEGQLFMPVQVVLDSEENLYVSDEACHTIPVFSKENVFLRRWGEHGTGDGQLKRPAGIAFDADENLLVVDTMNHRIQTFTKDGQFLKSWGSLGTGEGEFNMPWGVAVDDDGDVYVSDWRNDRIQKFSGDGQFIAAFGSTGQADGNLNRPSSVEVDADGFIYVADWGNERIQVFAPDFAHRATLQGEATLSRWAKDFLAANLDETETRKNSNLDPKDLPPQYNTPHLVSSQIEPYFWGPASVNVDPHGRMWVTETSRHRIQVYQKG